MARETYTQLVREEADQQKSFAMAESRKTSAETKLQSREAQLIRINQDETLNAESFADGEQEIASHKENLAVVEAELIRYVSKKLKLANGNEKHASRSKQLKAWSMNFEVRKVLPCSC